MEGIMRLNFGNHLDFMNLIIPYRRHLKDYARELRKQMTLAEQEIWEAIRKQRLGVEFHRQVPMLDYIVDFYCHEIGLVIEIDGRIHDFQALADGTRQARLEGYGVRFLRFTNEEVFERLPEVLKEMERVIEESLS